MIAFFVEVHTLVAMGVVAICGIIAGAVGIIMLAGDRARQDVERNDRLQ